ncbi:hypothetical protein Tco_1309935 [Tanacetum coccineum]
MAQAGRLNLRMQKELKLLLTDLASFSLTSIHALIQGLEGRVIDGSISIWFGTVGLTDGICKSTSEENKESVQCTDAFGQICRDRRISIEASPGGL